MCELTPARRCAISGLRRAFGNLPLVCGGLLAGLILAEVGLRIPQDHLSRLRTYTMRTRGIALKPGKQGWYYGEGGRICEDQQPGLPWRRVITREKPPGVFRYRGAGRLISLRPGRWSIADTFCKQLEKRLSGRPEFGNFKVEVLNFGIGGYGTDQELLTLRLHVLDFSPDLVMLAFCPGNDVSGNSRQLIRRLKIPTSPSINCATGSLSLITHSETLASIIFTAVFFSRRSITRGAWNSSIRHVVLWWSARGITPKEGIQCRAVRREPRGAHGRGLEGSLEGL